MKHQEKKYLVNSFAHIQKTLTAVHAKKIRHVTSTHYYGQHEGNDVKKFVEYPDHVAIHILKESRGTFTLTENTPIANKEEGFAWLTQQGYLNADIVKMEYTEYAYDDGTVGLYIIDDFFHSVILDFPDAQHETIEKDFGLGSAEVISLPYNKYLKQVGRLRSMSLS